MEDNKDILSRREFFKKAAKTALPIMAAAAMPAIFTSCEIKEPNVYGCTGSCSMNCSGGCTGCSSSCKGECTATCYRTCKGGCALTCSGGSSRYLR